MAKYRVAHLITKLELGGAQQNTLFCTEHHSREKFEVYLLAGEGGILDEEARAIPDANISLVGWLKHPIHLWYDFIALWKFKAYLKHHKLDLVHTHSSKAGILGRIAAKWAGTPAIVHTVPGWSFNDTQPFFKRKIYVLAERLCARWTDRMIVVSSENTKKGLAENIGREDQYQVIHSGIDIRSFEQPEHPVEQVRASLGYSPEDIVIGTIACLKPQKAPLDFVETARIALLKNPRLKFFIAGDGELLPQVKEKVAALGLKDSVQVLGWRRDVVDLHHAMDIFLLTSLFEGLPRAVVQSMAAGVPVVATAVDGTPEVVEDRVTGRLVPPSDPKASAEAILELAANPTEATRLANAAKARIDRAFEIHQMVRDLDELYLKLLSETETQQRPSTTK